MSEDLPASAAPNPDDEPFEHNSSEVDDFRDVTATSQDEHETMLGRINQIQANMKRLADIAVRADGPAVQSVGMTTIVDVPGHGVLNWERYDDQATGNFGLRVRMSRRTIDQQTGTTRDGIEVDAHLLFVDNEWQQDPDPQRVLSISAPLMIKGEPSHVYYLTTDDSGGQIFRTKEMPFEELDDFDIELTANHVQEFTQAADAIDTFTPSRTQAGVRLVKYKNGVLGPISGTQ